MNISNSQYTHEVRLTHYTGSETKTAVVYTGDSEGCDTYVLKISKEKKLGVGFLKTNGGYEVVDLQEERDRKVREAAPELLEALIAVLAYEKRGADKGEPRIGNGILSIIHKAIEKATK